MLDRYTIHAAIESDLPSATATITFIPKRWMLHKPHKAHLSPFVTKPQKARGGIQQLQIHLKALTLRDWVVLRCVRPQPTGLAHGIQGGA
jgi:hypothetical protein